MTVRIRWLFFASFLGLGFANDLCAQTNGPVVIPVVFHILHLGGSENISDAQVMDAVRILNLDYNRLSIDTADIIPAYRNNVANMQITFRLANLDPNGNCTNGIEHIYTSQTDVGAVPLLPGHEWPRNKYLNIWVYREFGLTPGAGAYTFAPWNADTLPSEDAVNIINSYVGSIGTSSPLTSRVLTYEIARYLGLLDLFCPENIPGGGCCDADSVADTPSMPLNAYISNCDTSILSCDSTLYDNFQNFMAYSYCSCMFTNGQKNRVYSYLNRSTAQRNNLWTSINLIATGTNDTLPTPCAPIANFSTPNHFICLGPEVTFYDNSYNGNITSRLWTFPPATAVVNSDTSKNVVVSFDSSGWQTVTLQVINPQGSSTISKTLIYVADPTVQITAPYFTSFEDTVQVSQTWTSINIDGDAPYFHPVSNAAHWGNSSILLNNFDSQVIWNEDDLISPAFDCSALTDSTCQISFWYSSATRAASLTSPIFDSMEVSISSNCGSSWTAIKHLGGAILDNAGSLTNSYTPATNSTWTKLVIPFSPIFIKPNVIFKISVFGANNSNNLYIDDFDIGNAPTGITETAANSLNVFPNPFNSEITVRGLAPSTYRITVSDVAGQTVFNVSEISPDKNGSATLNLSAIHSAGVYFIRIANNTTVQTLKIIKP